MNLVEDSAYLAYSLALHNEGLHLGEVVVVGDHVGDDGLLIGVLSVDVCMGHTGGSERERKKRKIGERERKIGER